MGEQLELDIVKDEDPPASEEKDLGNEEDEVKKPDKKIYKGTVVTVKELLDKGFGGPTPVQPIKQRIPKYDKTYRLPPTFIATKFRSQWGQTILDYYDVRNGMVSSRNVPPDFELNLLSGRRGEELRREWDLGLASRLHTMVGRLGCSIGSDPEIFAEYEKGEKKGQVMPAWEWVGGKDKPDRWQFADSMNGTCYWDGFQAEFTTPPSITCAMVLSDTIHAGILKLHNLAKKAGGKLTIKSVYEVHPDTLATAKPEHVAFGCSPSKNVYGLTGNTEEGRNVPFRFAGGHLHFGLADKREKETLIPLVRGLDFILGVASVSLFASFDSPIRRQFYGQPGEYRTPPHGLEYRVLSNAWLMHPLAMHLVYDLARGAGGLVVNGMMDVWKADEKEVVDCILAHDVTKAREILTRNKSVLEGVLKLNSGAYLLDGERAANIFLNGIESVVKDPEDLVNNWNLKGGWSHHNHMYSYHLKKLQDGKKV